jgi:hypothetical protein
MVKVNVTVTKNRKIVSGQLLDLGIIDIVIKLGI